MEIKAKGFVMALVLMHLCSLGYSTKMQQHFDQTIATHQDTAKNLANPGQLRVINPKDYAKGDTENVAAKNYYDNPEAMEDQARAAKETDQSAIAATDVHLNKRQTIDANNPAYKTALSHQENAGKILSDNGNRYHCTEVARPGSTKTTTATCQVSNVVPMQCIRYPEVRIIDTTIPAQDKAFDLTSNQFWRTEPWNGHIYFNLPYAGVLKSIEVILQGNFPRRGGGHTHYWLRIQPFHPGLIDHYHNPRGAFSLKFNNLSYNTTANQQAYLWINGREYIQVPNFTIRYKGIIQVPPIPRKEAKITWKDTCQNVNLKACVKTKEQCVEPGGTRNISGVNVTQDCWKYELAYTCGYKKYDNCDEIAKRCNFISQKCIEEADGYCYAYERTYQCSEAVEGAKELICGDPNSIEFKQKIEQGTGEDFAKAVAGLAGVSAAGNDLKKTQDQVNIMKGTAYNCGEAGMGLYDCCASGGNMLRHCSDSEQALQKARGKKLAVFAGRHCAKKALGVCLVYHQGWCVFESKLMRIIHEQGRRQLNLSFGSGEEPNCRGLTPDELQRIDFSRVDFSEIHDEMTLKKPSDKSIADAMAKVFQKEQKTPNYNKREADQLL